MREQELIEKIAQREAELHPGYYNRKYGYHRWDKLPPVMRAEIYDNADQIHAIYKEAGYKSPEEVMEIMKKQAKTYAERTLKEIADARIGYVKLAEDQSLPDNPFIAENEYSQHGWEESPRFVNYQKAQQAMLKAGWWKVKLEEKDGAKKGD